MIRSARRNGRSAARAWWTNTCSATRVRYSAAWAAISALGPGPVLARLGLPRALVVVGDRDHRFASGRRRGTQPRRDLLVPLGAHSSRQRVVGDVADQRVLPLVLGGAGDGTARPFAQQLSPRSARSVARGSGTSLSCSSRDPHTTAPHTDASCRTRFWIGGQTVETSGDHRRIEAGTSCTASGSVRCQPSGSCRTAPVLDEHADHLLQEQRVAVRSIDEERRHCRPSRARRAATPPASASTQRRARAAASRPTPAIGSRDKPSNSTGAGHGLRWASASSSSIEASAHCRSSSTTATVPSRAASSITSRVARMMSRSLRRERLGSSTPSSDRRSGVTDHDGASARSAGPPLDRRARGVDGRAGAHAQRARNDLRERGQPALAERAHRPTRNRPGASELPSSWASRLFPMPGSPVRTHHPRTAVRTRSLPTRARTARRTPPDPRTRPAGVARLARERTERLERDQELGLPLGLAQRRGP